MSDTSERYEGGPAFPGTVAGYGMSLRDWFAGQALIALARAHGTPHELAAWAYEFADAMLAQRTELRREGK